MYTDIAVGKSECRIPRLLIVDDKPQVRQGLRFILGLSDEVDVIGEASNGLEAVDKAQNLRPDVILMDLEMPEMDGYEATRNIKKEYPECIVIALTIHSDIKSRRKATLAGIDDVIEKGVSWQAILQVILTERKNKNGNQI